MRLFAVVVFAVVALACARPRRLPQPRRAAVAAPAIVAPEAPPRAPAWSAMFSMRNRVADQHPLPDVVVHAPAGFDARAPLHLVFMLHGIGHQALWWAGGGLTDPRTGRRVMGWGGEVRHDLAGVRSLFIAPQFEIR